MYKILLDRKVGQFDLHESVLMMGAGNKESDNAVSYGMGTALRSRLIHAQLVHSVPDWLSWAMDPAKGNIHHYITSFINFKANALYTFDPDSADDTYSSPRTMEFLSKMLHNKMDPTTPVGMALTVGTIGSIGREFQAFVKNYGSLPKITDILANPNGVDVPKDPGTLYALCGSLASWMDASNGSAMFTYINRIPAEYQVVTLRDAIKRNPTTRKVPEMSKWIMANAKSLLA